MAPPILLLRLSSPVAVLHLDSDARKALSDDIDLDYFPLFRRRTGPAFPLAFQHPPENAVFFWQHSEENQADGLILDVGAISTHVAYVLNHGSEDGDGVGSWFYLPRCYGLQTLNVGAKRRHRVCVDQCPPSDR